MLDGFKEAVKNFDDWQDRLRKWDLDFVGYLGAMIVGPKLPKGDSMRAQPGGRWWVRSGLYSSLSETT